MGVEGKCFQARASPQRKWVVSSPLYRVSPWRSTQYWRDTIISLKCVSAGMRVYSKITLRVTLAPERMTLP